MEYEYLINYRYKDERGNDRYAYVIIKARDWQHAIEKFKKKNYGNAVGVWARIAELTLDGVAIEKY